MISTPIATIQLIVLGFAGGGTVKGVALGLRVRVGTGVKVGVWVAVAVGVGVRVGYWVAVGVLISGVGGGVLMDRAFAITGTTLSPGMKISIKPLAITPFPSAVLSVIDLRKSSVTNGPLPAATAPSGEMINPESVVKPMERKSGC